MQVVRTTVLALGCAVALPALAFAHAHLKTSNPAADATLAQAPAEVAITFTEGLEPRFSTIEVTDAHGTAMQAGAAHLGADAMHFAVPLKPLPAGTYTVTWHATAVDTHKTDGKFTFTVRAPGS